MPAEGDITSSALLQTNADMNQRVLPLGLANFPKSLAPVCVGNEAFVTGPMENSNQCGWMLDKERMLTQLRTAERLLCKKMPSNTMESLKNCESKLALIPASYKL